MIQKLMQECDRLKATSVAFPALGTGNLGFPEDVVAEVSVRTISGYLQQNPGTTESPTGDFHGLHPQSLSTVHVSICTTSSGGRL